jgi:hypothetical protein
MAEVTHKEMFFVIKLTESELSFLKDITQNALCDNETQSQYLVREALFKMAQKALEDNT